jgi:pyridoxal phosphate enzyme (YggS family)
VSAGERAEELAENLRRVEERISRACATAGRPREEVTLVVVTKYFPATDVRILHGLGVRHVAESRHQEAVEKHGACADLDLVWHFVGQLQSNKAAAVAGWADVVQSVDRVKVLAGLDRAERSAPLDVLVQVNLDPVEERGSRAGVAPEGAAALAAEVDGHQRLRARGVMAVAPREGDPAEAFAVLARTRASVREAVPSADWMSAGMSGDLEQAVAAGATHVRVGTAVLGSRPGPR